MSIRIPPRTLLSRPTVSVVIPNYNYGRYLPTAVHSALDQPGVEVEVVIVDDCSTDGSVKIAQDLAASDTRITLIEHKQNMRHIATYNDGLRQATGKYVVLLSADDALSPGALSRAAALMEAEPSVALVYGHPKAFSTEFPPSDPTPESWAGAKATWTIWSGDEWIRQVCRRGKNKIVSPEAVVRTEVFRELGGIYDERFPHSADMYLWLRLAAHANVGRVNGMIQAYYREHTANMHSTWFGGLLDDLLARRNTFESFFAVDGAHIFKAERLARLARHRLARDAYRKIAYLNRPEQRGPEARTLIAFGKDLNPSDLLTRGYFRLAVESAFGPAIFRVERHRQWMLDQREMRVGS